MPAEATRGGRRGRKPAKHRAGGVPIRSQSSAGARRAWPRAGIFSLNAVVGFPTAGDMAGVCGCDGAPAGRIGLIPLGRVEAESTTPCATTATCGAFSSSAPVAGSKIIRPKAGPEEALTATPGRPSESRACRSTVAPGIVARASNRARRSAAGSGEASRPAMSPSAPNAPPPGPATPCAPVRASRRASRRSACRTRARSAAGWVGSDSSWR